MARDGILGRSDPYAKLEVTGRSVVAVERVCLSLPICSCGSHTLGALSFLRWVFGRACREARVEKHPIDGSTHCIRRRLLLGALRAMNPLVDLQSGVILFEPFVAFLVAMAGHTQCRPQQTRVPATAALSVNQVLRCAWCVVSLASYPPFRAFLVCGCCLVSSGTFPADRSGQSIYGFGNERRPSSIRSTRFGTKSSRYRSGGTTATPCDCD